MKTKITVFVGTAFAVAIMGALTSDRLFAQDSRGPVALVEAHEIMELFFEHEFEELKGFMQKEPESRNEWKGIFNGANELAEAHGPLSPYDFAC